MESIISSICPHCQKKYQLKEDFIGKEAECAECKQQFIITRDQEVQISQGSDISGSRKKQLILLFAVMGVVLVALFGSDYYKKWSFERSIRAPVNLGSCIDFTKKLLVCESFSCEYDSVNALINKKIHSNFLISGGNDNCGLMVETTINKKPYTKMICTNLNSVELEDLAYDYDITLLSKGTNFSMHASLNGESKITIDNKELKNATNLLLSKGKCSM